MTESMVFPIGAEVACSDGVCGDLSRVVVDPVARVVTHLVVEPKHWQGLGRLVPVELVEDCTDLILLRCATDEFARLADAEETAFLPDAPIGLGYAPGQVSAWPYYGLGAGTGIGIGIGIGIGMGMGNVSLPIVHDRVPVGEVEVRRGEQVHATDGALGRVQGLVIDPRDHHVTHVLLQEGHLWGRKEVAIPIRAVTGVAEGIHLGLTKDEVADLPPVEVEHPDWS